MKILRTILFSAALMGFLSTNAQVNKPSSVKKTTAKSTSQKRKPTPVKKAEPAEPKATAVQSSAKLAGQEAANESRQPTANQQESPKTAMAKVPTKTKNEEGTRPYKLAAGVKFLWGIAATGKYFFKDEQAIEAIVRYKNYAGVINEFTISALYEYQKPITEVPGLYWLVGGGAYFGTVSVKDFDIPDEFKTPSNTYFGIAGIAGLEYKFEKLPIAISADWMPAVNIKGGGGFSAENGGLGVKYLF